MTHKTIKYNNSKIDRLAAGRYLVQRGFFGVTFGKLNDAKRFVDERPDNIVEFLRNLKAEAV